MSSFCIAPVVREWDTTRQRYVLIDSYMGSFYLGRLITRVYKVLDYKGPKLRLRPTQISALSSGDILCVMQGTDSYLARFVCAP